MSRPTPSSQFSLTPSDNKRLAILCGQFDEHLRLVEKRLGVEISNRGNKFNIAGDANSVAAAKTVLNKLYKDTQEQDHLTPEQVHLSLQASKQQTSSKSDQTITTTSDNVPVKARNKSQELYLQNILSHDINFGIGPAGTGKTYLAAACAVQALETEQVQRIVLVRPVVEAGENLGFLPGDLTQKIDPYLRPLYDALNELLGTEKTTRYLERGIIEIVPLAYMRGRTLNDSFVILDEAQNATPQQMKMFLTRIGFNSKTVVNGDVTQIDLPGHIVSGLKHAIATLKTIPGISFTYFSSSDVVRHPLVQAIVEAYEKSNELLKRPRKE